MKLIHCVSSRPWILVKVHRDQDIELSTEIDVGVGVIRLIQKAGS
jgi:hypothetical protein